MLSLQKILEQLPSIISLGPSLKVICIDHTVDLEVDAIIANFPTAAVADIVATGLQHHVHPMTYF